MCHLQLSVSDPGCYNLTKKLTADTNNPLSTSHPTTPSSNMFTDKHVEMYVAYGTLRCLRTKKRCLVDISAYC